MRTHQVPKLIAPDKKNSLVNIFLISPCKHVVGTHQKCLCEALLVSTQNICLYGENNQKYNYFLFKKCSLPGAILTGNILLNFTKCNKFTTQQIYIFYYIFILDKHTCTWSSLIVIHYMHSHKIIQIREITNWCNYTIHRILCPYLNSLDGNWTKRSLTS